MASNVVTLYIDDANLRLLVANGKQVKKWATLPLEPGLVKDGVITNEAKVAAKIKELFQTQGVKAGKIIAGLSGLHSLTRPVSIPNLPKALVAEAVRQEAEKMLPVPLEQLYLAWQTIYTAEGKTYLFVVALPRNAADALVQTLHQAGLDPEMIDIKPLALARVVDEPTAIIVDVQPNDFDIVIMAYGIPQPIRSLALPQNALTWQQKMPIIIADLDRTIKFYNTGNPGKPLDAKLPVYVSGDLAQAPDACEALSKELGHPVVPLSSMLTSSGQLDTGHYMVNIGLALKQLSLGKRKSVSVVNVNALPDVYQPKPMPINRILVPASLVLGVGLLGYLFTIVQGASAQATALEAKLASTQQTIKQKQASQKTERDAVTALEQQVTGLEGSVSAFTATFSSFGVKQERVNGDLEATTSLLPLDDTVMLSTISHNAPTMTLAGTSDNETFILDYASNLRDTGRFDSVTVSSIEVAGNMEFTLTLKAKEQ